MSYRYLLMLLGVVLVLLGIAEQGWFFAAVWLGGDFLILGIAHARGLHGVFGKRVDGTLPLWSWVLFFPLLLYTLGVWHLIRIFNREASRNIVTERLVVGRRLLSSEIDEKFDNYVDLTAEFVEPQAISHTPAYRSFPILDGSTPSPETLKQAVAGLRAGRTFIHCAQGHGRTGLFALAVLLNSGEVHTINEGMKLLRVARPGISLNKEQIRCIKMYAERAGYGL